MTLHVSSESWLHQVPAFSSSSYCSWFICCQDNVSSTLLAIGHNLNIYGDKGFKHRRKGFSAGLPSTGIYFFLWTLILANTTAKICFLQEVTICAWVQCIPNWSQETYGIADPGFTWRSSSYTKFFLKHCFTTLTMPWSMGWRPDVVLWRRNSIRILLELVSPLGWQVSEHHYLSAFAYHLGNQSP